jgi:hypothetical protein
MPECDASMCTSTLNVYCRVLSVAKNTSQLDVCSCSDKINTRASLDSTVARAGYG